MNSIPNEYPLDLVLLHAMVPLHYTYLLGASLFIVPWAIIFYFRKDVRPILVAIGLISIPISLIAEYYWWTTDWWQPLTITNTRIGIEDVLLSFMSVGVSASLYLVIMRKKFVGSKRPDLKRSLVLSFVAVVCLFLFAVLFAAGVNSFVSTIIVLSVAVLFLLSTKPTLAIPALVNGGMTVALVIPIFLVMFAVTPGYVEQTWLLHNLIGIYHLGIPIEDIVFYCIGGAVCFSAYPYITNSEIVRLNSHTAS